MVLQITKFLLEKMSKDFFYWALVFFIQFSLLIRSFYGTILVSDLETDYLNTHDFANKINSFLMIELGGHILLFLVLAVAGKWLLVAVQLIPLLYFVALMARGELTVTPNTALNKASVQRRRYYVTLVVYGVVLAVGLFRLSETVVVDLLSPLGRQHASELLHEAAAAIF